MVSADQDRPYDRPYLSKEFLRGEVDIPKVYLHSEEDYSTQAIELELGRRAVGGSLDGNLHLDGGAELTFQTLLIATGGTPRRLAGVPDADNLFTLRSLKDGQAIREALGQSSRLMLLGAGFIGAEVAASARQLGKEVLIVEAAPVPLARALGEDVGRTYASIHRSKGVDLRTGTTVEKWHTRGTRVTGVTLSDGKREAVDMVLEAVGIEPNLDLPRALGLPLAGGGVQVDDGLRAAPNVYCAGDIAFHPHPVLGREIRVEHWEVAKGHGRGVAGSITAGHEPYRKLPYFWSDQYDVTLEYRGHAFGEDTAVWRGDRDGHSFSVFYIRDGLIDAVLSMNDKKTNELGGKLIEARRPVKKAALADKGSDLSELLPAAS